MIIPTFFIFQSVYMIEMLINPVKTRYTCYQNPNFNDVSPLKAEGSKNNPIVSNIQIKRIGIDESFLLNSLNF